MTHSLTRSLTRSVLVPILLVSVVVVGLEPATAYPRPGSTERVSLGAEGEGNLASFKPSLSADGRYVAFWSEASNLVPGDTNELGDVFVRDRLTSRTERISVASDGAEVIGESWWPSMSDDGRFVAFVSDARALAPGDSNEVLDIFLHDRETGTTERVSVTSSGAEPDGPSSYPWIAADGRSVAFSSLATNLVPGDTNGLEDVFVRDLNSGLVERVSIASDGTGGNNFSILPSSSGDGRYVAFESVASNLVPGDTNGKGDAFVHDRLTNMTERVSMATSGAESNHHSLHPAISADGRYVSFGSAGSNLVPNDDNAGDHQSGIDVFVHDRETGETERVSVASDGSEGNSESTLSMISADGRYVAFQAFASDLVPDDTNGAVDVFVHDRVTGETDRVSVTTEGGEADAHSLWFAMSADGRHIAFESWATNLVPDKANLCPSVFGPLPCRDVYVRDRGPSTGVAGVSVGPEEGGRIHISGSAILSGQVIAAATDPNEDGEGGAAELGGELTGASLTFRPQQEDVLVRLRLHSFPLTPLADGSPWDVSGGAGAPGVLYGLEMKVGSATYEMRAIQAGATGDPTGIATEPPGFHPVFALYRCDAECVEVARLAGGMGTTGSEVRVSIPTAAIGATAGTVLDELRAFTALGEASPGAVRALDEARLPDALIPAVAVSVGLAPAGTPENAIEFDITASLNDGAFNASVDLSGHAPGERDLWTRACVGQVCGAIRVPIRLGS